MLSRRLNLSLEFSWQCLYFAGYFVEQQQPGCCSSKSHCSQRVKPNKSGVSDWPASNDLTWLRVEEETLQIKRKRKKIKKREIKETKRKKDNKKQRKGRRRQTRI